MNITIDFKTAKTIDSMSQQISHMDNAVTDFFNKMSDVLERQLGDDEVYAAVAPSSISGRKVTTCGKVQVTASVINSGTRKGRIAL